MYVKVKNGNKTSVFYTKFYVNRCNANKKAKVIKHDLFN